MYRQLITLSLVACVSAGCGPGLMNEPGVPGLDVGGPSGADWSVAFNDPITVTVTDVAGVARVSRLPMTGGDFQVGQAKISSGAAAGILRDPAVSPPPSRHRNWLSRSLQKAPETVENRGLCLHFLRVGSELSG